MSNAGLVELYTVNNTVRLTTGSNAHPASVHGVVPVGKTLEIAGAVYIADGKTLDVRGTLHILENGELIPEDPADSVLLVDRNGTVVVEGFVYEEPAFFPVTGGLARGVNFGPTGGVVVNDATGLRAEDVNAYFDLVNRVKWTTTAASWTPLSAANLFILDKWLPGKTLILSGDATITTGTSAVNTDVSPKGNLIMAGTLKPDGTVTLVTATVAAGQTFTTNGRPVLIAETATLELENTAADKSYLAGKFKVNGTLSATTKASLTSPFIFETSVIPPAVDLTAATILGDRHHPSYNAVFKFLPSTIPGGAVVSIKKIDTTYNVGIANTKGLIVDLISNTGANASRTLTIPNNIDTVVKRIDTNAPAGDYPLVIKGEDSGPASYAVFKPKAIYGADGVKLNGSNILLTGEVTVASDTTITAAALGPFGITGAEQLGQLGRINGGTVNLGAAPVTITIPSLFNTQLMTTGAVIFAADATLNRGMAGAASYTIRSGVKLTVGPYGQFKAGKITVGPGVYAAGGSSGGNFVISGANGVISAGTAGTVLTIGDAGTPAKFTLKSLGTAAAAAPATFTPAEGVTLNGLLGAIIVPNGARFTVGATAELNIGGGGQVALGIDPVGTGGILGIGAAGGKISGFGAAVPATKADDAVHGTIAGVRYDGQITVANTNVTFARGAFTATDAAGKLFTAAVGGTPLGNGAVIRNNSF
jgi:hypothetical protein